MTYNYVLAGDNLENLVRVTDTEDVAKFKIQKYKKRFGWVDDIDMGVIFTDHIKSKEITEEEALKFIESYLTTLDF